MGLRALLAEIELAAESFCAALLDLAHYAKVGREHAITKLCSVVCAV
jgi:hypothetical protein